MCLVFLSGFEPLAFRLGVYTPKFFKSSEFVRIHRNALIPALFKPSNFFSAVSSICFYLISACPISRLLAKERNEQGAAAA